MEKIAKLRSLSFPHCLKSYPQLVNSSAKISFFVLNIRLSPSSLIHFTDRKARFKSFGIFNHLLHNTLPCIHTAPCTVRGNY